MSTPLLSRGLDRFPLVVVLLVFALVLASCTTGEPADTTGEPADTTVANDESAETTEGDSGEEPDAEVSGNLRVGVTTFGPEAWDPIQADSTAANALIGLVTDWLVHVEAGEFSPGVLESFEMSEDGSYWDLRLREGLQFHDGSDATVEDLEFTFERFMSEDALRPHLRNAVERTEVLDDLTLRVFVTEPNPYFVSYLTSVHPNQGALMPKAYIEENGLEHYMENPIGVGPWQFEEGVPGDSYRFSAYQDYWAGAPAFDELTTVLVPELTAQRSLLETGELDVIYTTLDEIPGLEEAGFNTFEIFAPQTRIDLFGTYDPRAEGLPTADIRVREALFRAIDYDAINVALFDGRGLERTPPRVLQGMAEVDPGWTEYVEEIWAYDPERARELLTEAGYPDGFTFDLFVSQPAGIPYMNDLSEIVQAYWADVGVTAEITQLELAEYNEIRGPVDRVVGQAVFASTGILSPAPTNMSWVWHSSGGHAIHADRRGEEPIIFLPELEELVSSALTELDPDQRHETIQEFIQMGLDTYTSYTFGQSPTLIATAPGVEFPELQQPLTTSSIPAFVHLAFPQ